MLERFREQLADPRGTQSATLARLVAQLATGRFGREHGLDQLGGVRPEALADELRRRVPLRNFEGLRAYIEPAPEDLSGERPLCLLRTSASTGKPKLIPYTVAFRDSIKRAHDVFSLAMFADFPSLPLQAGVAPRGLGLYQLSTAAEQALGLPVDSYVSRLYDVALPEDPFFFALDEAHSGVAGGRALCQIASAKERLFAMALTAAAWDLRGLRATNPTTLLLFSRVIGDERERLCRALADGVDAASGVKVAANPALARKLSSHGALLGARDLWPNLELLVTWRGGTCHLFEPHLRQAFGDARIRAPIFAASEGVVAIPLADADLGGAPAVDSSFFEFLPHDAAAATADDAHAETKLLHELEVGQRYELVFTAPTGMTRYRIGDLVEVDGLVGNTPTFHFLARKGRTSSLTGEKLTELQVEEAVGATATKLSAQPIHFLLSAQFEALPYYVLSVDFGATPPSPDVRARFAAAVDEELARRNIEYQAKRDSARLGPVRLRRVRPGEFERLQASGLSGGGAINFKLAHLSSEPVHDRLLELP